MPCCGWRDLLGDSGVRDAGGGGAAAAADDDDRDDANEASSTGGVWCGLGARVRIDDVGATASVRLDGRCDWSEPLIT
jgi:hypothetical protein